MNLSAPLWPIVPHIWTVLPDITQAALLVVPFTVCAVTGCKAAGVFTTILVHSEVVIPLCMSIREISGVRLAWDNDHPARFCVLSSRPTNTRSVRRVHLR